jgi:hypothetical protein
MFISWWYYPGSNIKIKQWADCGRKMAGEIFPPSSLNVFLHTLVLLQNYQGSSYRSLNACLNIEPI